MKAERRGFVDKLPPPRDATRRCSSETSTAGLLGHRDAVGRLRRCARRAPSRRAATVSKHPTAAQEARHPKAISVCFVCPCLFITRTFSTLCACAFGTQALQDTREVSRIKQTRLSVHCRWHRCTKVRTRRFFQGASQKLSSTKLIFFSCFIELDPPGYQLPSRQCSRQIGTTQPVS